MRAATAVIGISLAVAACGSEVAPLGAPIPTAAAPTSPPVRTEPPAVPASSVSPAIGAAASELDRGLAVRVDPGLLATLEALYVEATAHLLENKSAPDPDDSELGRYFFALGLTRHQDRLADMRARGQVLVQPPDSIHRVEAMELVDVSDGSARVRFCLLDDTHVLDPVSGEAQSGDAARFSVAVDFIDIAGDWRIIKEVLETREDGVTTCDGL